MEWEKPFDVQREPWGHQQISTQWPNLKQHVCPVNKASPVASNSFPKGKEGTVEKQCGWFLIGGLQSALLILFAIPNWDDYPQLPNYTAYIYIYTHVYIYICTHVYIYIHICIYIYNIYIYLFIFIYVYVYLYLRVQSLKQQPLLFHLQAGCWQICPVRSPKVMLCQGSQLVMLYYNQSGHTNLWWIFRHYASQKFPEWVGTC